MWSGLKNLCKGHLLLLDNGVLKPWRRDELCRLLFEWLIADFPDTIRRWTAEKLDGMDTQDLLSETGNSDLQTALG